MSDVDQGAEDIIAAARERRVSLEQAKRNIADVAAELALRIEHEDGDKAAEIRGRADALDVIATAVSRIEHGPQGGRYDRRDLVDYHYRAGTLEGRERRPAGFVGGENGVAGG